MRFSARRLVLSTLTTVTVIGATPAVLFADPIRLQSREEDRLAKDLEKRHPSPGKHLGWYDKTRKVKPEPDRRRDPNSPEGDGGRLIDREPGAPDDSGGPHFQPPKVTPEPGTLALLATGIGAVALRSWRRRHLRPRA
jgi:hypothetical protein